MTLNKYDQAMERLTLSPEARERILGNLRQAEANAPARGKVVRFPQWKRWAAVAACAAVVLLAAVALNPRADQSPGGPQGEVSVSNGMVEVADAQALSEALGFAVPELGNLPFAVTQTSYVAFWGEMAQIVYTGGGQSVTFRMQPGSADVSGDYNEYASVRTVDVDGAAVACKGDGDTVCTAVWTRGGYSYAILAEAPLRADAMLALVRQVG